MKKVTLALLIATFFAVPDAHAVFQGVLKSGLPTTITLTTPGNIAGATVLGVRKNKLTVLGILTALPFGTAQLALPSLPKVERIIITVDGNTMLQVVQDTINDQFGISPADIVYNVVPGP
jgi:hypothetical protein